MGHGVHMVRCRHLVGQQERLGLRKSGHPKESQGCHTTRPIPLGRLPGLFPSPQLTTKATPLPFIFHIVDPDATHLNAANAFAVGLEVQHQPTGVAQMSRVAQTLDAGRCLGNVGIKRRSRTS